MSAWCVLVEDEPVLARTLVRLLRTRGLDVTWVRGLYGLKKELRQRSGQPALLVLDVDLGAESGLLIARVFSPRMHVLFWTGEPESVPTELRCRGIEVFSKGDVAGVVAAAVRASRK